MLPKPTQGSIAQPPPPPRPTAPIAQPPHPQPIPAPRHVPEPRWRRRHAALIIYTPTVPPAPLPLPAIYHRARQRFGHQHWWPGDTPFEVCVGAILTQNTAWKNVERAIANLKSHGPLTPKRLAAIPEPELALLLRPTGYFNVKARRLRAFLQVLLDSYQGRLDRLFQGSTAQVRARLLALPGIGPETADSMLLYAGNHPSFVVDAYTRRILLRHGWCDANATYHDLQRLCSLHSTPPDSQPLLDYWQDAHAQFVAVGKDFCRPRAARCPHCPLADLLPNDNP